jgi:hypothetical protein
LLVQSGVELAGSVREAGVIVGNLPTMGDGFLVGEFLIGSEVGVEFHLLVVGEVGVDAT